VTPDAWPKRDGVGHDGDVRFLRPRSIATALVSLTLLATVLGLPNVAPAGAAPPSSVPSVTSTTVPLDETQRPITRIIPLPNTGHKPTSPGDGGGFLQVSLFFFICAAILLLGVLAFLDGRRKLRKAALAAEHST
jgi:hypothetical protein